MTEFLKTFISNNAVGILAIVATPLLAWWFNRPKQNSEVKKTEADTTSVLTASSGSLVTGWEKFAEKMQAEYNQCQEATIKLQQELQSQRQAVDEGKEKVEQLDNKVNIVTGHNNELEVKLETLTQSNQDLQTKVQHSEVQNDRLKKYTQRLVNFIETLLDQIEKIDPDKATENVKELEIIKVQFKEE
jgi:chromosome segregation ATPase